MGKDRMRLQVSGLSACSIVFGAFAQQVTHTATFNNIGMEVTISAATSSSSGITMAISNTQAPQTWQQCHPLSRVAADRFAGSIFGLASGTRYVIRLHSVLFSQDIFDTSFTRADSFAAPTGAIYHVAVGGNDSRSGASLAQAFATLGHGVSIAQPGATILLHAGHYHESIDLPRSGTAAAPILIRNAPGKSPYLTVAIQPSGPPGLFTMQRAPSTGPPARRGPTLPFIMVSIYLQARR